MEEVVCARLLHFEKLESFKDEILRMCLSRHRLGGFENKALENHVVENGPMLGIPAPELAIFFIAKMGTTVEMTVQHRLRQLLAGIGRLQRAASGVLRDVTGDLTNFGLLERRIAASRIDACEGCAYFGFL
jgi:hypothetical protein